MLHTRWLDETFGRRGRDWIYWNFGSFVLKTTSLQTSARNRRGYDIFRRKEPAARDALQVMGLICNKLEFVVSSFIEIRSVFVEWKIDSQTTEGDPLYLIFVDHCFRITQIRVKLRLRTRIRFILSNESHARVRFVEIKRSMREITQGKFRGCRNESANIETPVTNRRPFQAK